MRRLLGIGNWLTIALVCWLLWQYSGKQREQVRQYVENVSYSLLPQEMR